jgi:hypothetical protein
MAQLARNTATHRSSQARRKTLRQEAIIALLLLVFPPQVFGQVLRDPPTPFHLLPYDDVPADQQNPAWPHDFWAPMKFIPLDIAPTSYLNFGGELRVRVEHFSRPLFGLTPRGTSPAKRALRNPVQHPI